MWRNAPPFLERLVLAQIAPSHVIDKSIYGDPDPEDYRDPREIPVCYGWDLEDWDPFESILDNILYAKVISWSALEGKVGCLGMNLTPSAQSCAISLSLCIILYPRCSAVD